MNGSCGTANGGTFSSAPTSNLCIAGTPSAVTQDGNAWIWQCTGNGNGNLVSGCFANMGSGSTSSSGSGSSGGGVSGGGIIWGFYGNGGTVAQDNALIASTGQTFTTKESYVGQPGQGGWAGWNSNLDYELSQNVSVIPPSAGGQPMVAISPMMSGDATTTFNDINSGAHDGDLNYLFQQYAAAGYTEMSIRPLWEFNLGSVNPGNQQAFIQAFQHIANLAHSNSYGIKVDVIWNPGAGNTDPIPYYPGDSYVDWVGIDESAGFGDQGNYTDPLDLNPDDYKIGGAAAFAVQHNKPLAVCEGGVASSGYTEWLGNVLTALNQTGAKLVLYGFYDATDTGADERWQIDQPDINAVINFIQNAPAWTVSTNSGASATGIAAKIANGIVGTVSGSNGSTATFTPGQVTMPTAAPAASNVTFTDNFANLNNWTLIAPDTPDGRGGPNYNEQGDQWWTNPNNPNTPDPELYMTGNGLQLGLEPTPASQQAYINSQAGANMPFIGTLLASYPTSYQQYGTWQITATVPAVPGTSFQGDIENVQVTGTWPPEIDLRISTDQSGVQTVLFDVASNSGTQQWTTSSSQGFNAAVSHTYAWDWETDNITFYIDGNQVWQVPTPQDGTYTTNPDVPVPANRRQLYRQRRS